MPEARAEILLALDYGFTRLGLASGDTLTRTAAPRTTLAVHEGAPDWRALERVIADLRPARLIVGEPYNADGTPGRLTEAARRFARDLSARFALPVDLVDERWSSLDAQERLRAARAGGARRRRVTKEAIDAQAAAVILERWFDRAT